MELDAHIVRGSWLSQESRTQPLYRRIFLMSGIRLKIKMQTYGRFCQTQAKNTGGGATKAIIGWLLFRTEPPVTVARIAKVKSK